MNKLYQLVLLGGTISCSPQISYIGNTSSPTQKVDVYVDESAITKKYTIVGKGYVRTMTAAIPESLQRKALAKAREKGADAVLFKDYIPAVQGTTTTTRNDSASKTVSVISTTSIPQASSPDVYILFLKYNE